MSIKRIFIVISAIFAASTVFADNSSVTSKKYVDNLMSGYQGKLPGSGANTLMIYDDETGIGEKSIETTLGNSASATSVPTVGAVKGGLDGKQDTITGTAGYVMTGTSVTGEVGERAIYSADTNYSDALVTAETVNTGVINAVNSSLIRVNEQGAPSDSGTLWEIQDDLVALNICSNYTPATGTVVQNGTPTPTNPIAPVFYQQGDMILRAVGNYADSYDATTNKITRRVGVKVLDGTEDWRSNTSDNALVINATSNWGVVAGLGGFCTHLTVLKSGETTFNGSCRFATDFNIYGYKTTFGVSDIPGFKQYLADQYAAGTPVVMYYPLATAVTEDMPPRCQ